MAVEFAGADLPRKEFGTLSGGSDLFDAEVLVDEDFFPAASAPTGTQIKYWTGSAWATGALKRWTGSAWVDATIQKWTGSAWVAV